MSSEALKRINQQIKNIESPVQVLHPLDPMFKQNLNLSKISSYLGIHQPRLCEENTAHISKLWSGERYVPPQVEFIDPINCRPFSICQKFTIHLKSSANSE